MSLRNSIKGWIGETKGAIAQWAFLDSKVYTSLNNVTLQTNNGTTQIDHVIVSKYGIFVVESKNIEGWIFGNPKAAQWTVSKPGRKFQMQNPLRQNYRHVKAIVDHVKAIVDFLKIEESKVHSVVMFWGKCQFKTEMPANVMNKGYATYIKSFDQQLFADDEVISMVEALRSGALPKTWATRNAHIDSIKERLSSTTTCAKCGSPLTLRTARSGANVGKKFYGCTAYPKCRHIVPYTE